MKFYVVLEPAEEGGFNVSIPALDECFTEGDTEEEALQMLSGGARKGERDQGQTRRSCQRSNCCSMSKTFSGREVI